MKTAKLGLDRIRAVLEALGNPERRRIAWSMWPGPMAKGSTCAMIVLPDYEPLAFAPDCSPSPHLVEPTERIQVDGIPVTSSAVFDERSMWCIKAAEKLVVSQDIDEASQLCRDGRSHGILVVS